MSGFKTSCIVLLAVLILQVVSSQYTVTAKRMSNQPILSSQNNQSIFEYNYNAAYVPLFNEIKIIDSVLVRCQSVINGKLTGSVLALSAFTDTPFDMDPMKIVNTSVVFQPETVYESYGTEDPRVVYNPQDQTYYMLYSAVQNYFNGTIMSRLSLATTKNPANPNGWTRYGPIFPAIGWSKSGAMIIRESPPHYLIFGDKNLTLATSNNLINWTIVGTYITTRNTSFDSLLVESGPPPMLLSDGNYFFIYNSAYTNESSSSGFDYNPGFLIINGSNPAQILYRTDTPLVSPTLGWEHGVPPYLDNTPNVIFIEGMKRELSDTNTFYAFYGAADSVLGLLEVQVVINNQ